MKCPKCNGAGKIIHDWLPHETCHNCGGSGYVDMTEQEYLQTCNTEQLAEWIASVVQKAISIKENNGIVMLESVIWWGEWLKQPHTFK